MWFSYWLRRDWRRKKRPRVYRWSETNKPPSPGEREGEGRICGMTKAVDEPFHLLPSLTCPLFAPVWYLFHPQKKSTANPAQVPKWSLSPFTSFTPFLPLFSRFCPTRSLFSFLQSTLCLASFVPLCVIDLAKRSRSFHLLVPDGSHPTRMFCNTENEVA